MIKLLSSCLLWLQLPTEALHSPPMGSTQQQAGGERCTVLYGSLPAVPTSACTEPAEEAQNASQAQSAVLGLAFVFPHQSTLVGQLTAEEELTSIGVGKENVEEKKKPTKPEGKSPFKLCGLGCLVGWEGREPCSALTVQTSTALAAAGEPGLKPSARGFAGEKGAKQNGGLFCKPRVQQRGMEVLP